MKPTLIKFAASTLALGTGLVSFAPIANSNNVSAAESRDAREAAEAAEESREALGEQRSDRAIRYAERAVEHMPRSAEYRHLLGRAYMADGRFGSAETSFQDALTLNPDLTRTGFNLALSQIAQGNTVDALAELRDLEGRISASDLGLAFALAGDRNRAIDILQQAARANGGDPRARQNLALAYALDGRWGEARITASQDVSPAVVDQRMRDWALYAQPTNNWDQVAGLLGVESDGSDAGQPVRLALAPAQDSNVMMADAPAEAAPIVAFTAPVETNTIVSDEPVSQGITEVDVPEVIEANPEPMRTEVPVAEVAPMPAYDAPAANEFIVEDEVEYAAVDVAPPAAPAYVPPAAPIAAPAPIAAEAPLAPVDPEPAPAPVVVAAPAPEPTPQPAPQRRNGDGNYYVQLGAFARQSNVDIAWNRAVSRSAVLANYEPSSARFERGRTLYRLSFGGFQSRTEARDMCRSLRRQRVDCFVRARAGDAPVRMAARSGAGYAALR